MKKRKPLEPVRALLLSLSTISRTCVIYSATSFQVLLFSSTWWYWEWKWWSSCSGSVQNEKYWRIYKICLILCMSNAFSFCILDGKWQCSTAINRILYQVVCMLILIIRKTKKFIVVGIFYAMQVQERSFKGEGWEHIIVVA